MGLGLLGRRRKEVGREGGGGGVTFLHGVKEGGRGGEGGYKRWRRSQRGQGNVGFWFGLPLLADMFPI